jgi:biotin carboxylase
MEKLLLLGDNVHTDTLVKSAQGRGIYTIVSHNRPIEESQAKKLADEYWDISVTDIDLLEERARKEGITAVFCGASELCMNSVRELCKRLNLRFCVSDKAWEYTNDKQMFKEACMECGLPVAKDFQLSIEFKPEDLKNIDYPVVVKPTDGCSSIGVHICKNEDELIAGYKHAYEVSLSKKVVVEKFYSGEEISFSFVFDDKKTTLTACGDYCGKKDDNIPCVFVTTPSRYMERYEKEWKDSFKKLFEKLECKHGFGFVQMIKDNDQVAILEMNYRLPGSKIDKQEIYYDHIFNYLFNEDKPIKFDFGSTPNIFMYLITLHPGKVKEISGVEEIKRQLPVVFMDVRKKEGDIVEKDSGSRQLFAIITMLNQEGRASEYVDFINATLKVNDDHGSDMVYRYSYE